MGYKDNEDTALSGLEEPAVWGRKVEAIRQNVINAIQRHKMFIPPAMLSHVHTLVSSQLF